MKNKKQNIEIITTEELDHKLNELYDEMMDDYFFYVLNNRQRDLSINAVIETDERGNYSIVDYEYDDLEPNTYYIHNDEYIRINVYSVICSGCGGDEWYDDAIKIWCDDHSVKYYDDENDEFYSDYNRDEVNEIFKEMFFDYVEIDNRFDENFEEYIND